MDLTEEVGKRYALATCAERARVARKPHDSAAKLIGCPKSSQGIRAFILRLQFGIVEEGPNQPATQ